MTEENDSRPKVCRVNMRSGENRAWDLEIDDQSPECREALKEIYSNLGEVSGSYLTKRLTIKDPELKRIVEGTKKDGQ